MFLLITGASGAGKSTTRRAVEAKFSDRLDAVELVDVGGTPQWTLEWRHRAVERAVQRALESQRRGSHFLLCGDPVPPGELLAVPSASALEAPLAVCLLDVSAEAQRARLLNRGDDPELLDRHVVFADWMRAHVADPRHRPDVIMGSGWDAMRWDRWLGCFPAPWTSHVIDTSQLDPAAVAERAAAWIRRTIAPSAE